MRSPRLWIAIVSILVPRGERADWREEWSAELEATGGSMPQAWGALADAWSLRRRGWSVDAQWRDVRAALRGFRRQPLFTVIAGLTLAVGIGANTAIYSLVDAVLVDPLPYPESDRLVSYNFTAPGLGLEVFPHSQATYVHFASGASRLDALTVVDQDDVTVLTDAGPEQLDALRVTHEFEEVMGVPPVLGPGLVDGDDEQGADPVVLLSHPLWTRLFGRDRGAIGKTLEVDGVRRRIVGVMPEGFSLFGNEQLFLPLAIDHSDPDTGSYGLLGLGRLTPGSDAGAAGTEASRLLDDFVETHPDQFTPEVIEEAGLVPHVMPLKEFYAGDLRGPLLILLGAVGCVLLVACANVANLFLVRAEGRHHERAVRTALGASRLDLLRQHLTESVALGIAGGLAGLGLSELAVRGLLRLAPVDLPSALSVDLDGSVLAFTAAVSIGAGVLFGLLPLLGGRGVSASISLREGGRNATEGRARHRLRSTLVVTQVALALVLLIGSGLMARTFSAMRGADLGFDPGHRLTFRVAVTEALYPDHGATAEFYRRLQERIAGLPGVRDVGMVSALPLSNTRSANQQEPVDRPLGDDELGTLTEHRSVTPGYFRTMGTELVAGRDIDWDAAADGAREVVIDESLARAFWPGRTAVGQRLRSRGEENTPWEVVGVVEDVHQTDIVSAPQGLLYRPTVVGEPDAAEPVRAMSVVVWTEGDPLDLVAAVRTALEEVDPRLPMIATRTMANVVEESMATTSFAVLLFGVAATVALILGTVGLYGVVAWVVSRRTREIGIRMALGASAPGVRRALVLQSLRLTGVGVGLGLVGAWGLGGAIRSLLYGVAPTDPITYGVMASLLIAVAAIAAWIPARHASRIDPVRALTSD